MSTATDLIKYSHNIKCLRSLCKSLNQSKKYRLIDGKIDSVEYRFLDGSGVNFDRHGNATACSDMLHFCDEFI